MSDRAQLLGEGPRACPFVAFDDDRDRRSDEPDHRHRCYAEPTPAPRAIAHQSAYCLSPSFAACPIFLDWAVRAAADPVPSASVAAAWAERAATPSAEQLSAFPEPAPAILESENDDLEARPGAPAPVQTPATGQASVSGPAAMRPPVARGAAIGPYTGDRASAGEPWQDAESAPTDAQPPAFLAGRHRPAEHTTGPSPRPRVPTQARPVTLPKRAPGDRDPVLASRERPRRVEAYPALRPRSRVPRIPPVAIAAVALILAAAALFLLPGLLAGPGAGPGSTATPSATVVESREPTPTPGPTATTYTVRSGDTLSGIARRFGLTVDQLICANQLVDPNRLAVDQVLIIPDAEFECPASPVPAASG
jgi:nucleoid-associated protein YgaU